MTDPAGRLATPGAAERGPAAELPEHLHGLVRGFMQNRCVLTALELNVFTAVGKGASAAEAASRIGGDPRATQILLNALVALGLLNRQGEQYKNTAETEQFFAEGGPDSHRSGLLHVADLWHRWSTLTEVVRSGRRVPGAGGDSPDQTRNFIAAMQHNARAKAPAMVKALGVQGVGRILDLGGGSGIYSIAFARASPTVQCTILDLPEVVPLTQEYIARAGLAAQITIRPGNMLDDELGAGYDLVLLNAICHMFSEDENKELFHRARLALAPGGRLAMQDFILNPDKTGPRQAALFSVNMLVGTAGGACYSEPEYTAWMQQAGFSQVHSVALPGPGGLIVGQLA